MTCDGSNANAAAPGGEICVEEVKNKGCRGYINMDDPRYGKRGGQYSVQDCAAAVKRLDGKEGCKGKKYFFYEMQQRFPPGKLRNFRIRLAKKGC